MWGMSDPTEPGGLRRSLGVRDLMVYGLLFIAPMAPVGVFGVLDARSHGAVAAVYLVATVAMGFTALSYAQMVRAVPRAGSVFAYARAGLGEGPGFIAGWMAMLDYLLIPAVAYLFSGIALHSLVPGVSRWVWTVLAVLVTTALNLAGVRTAATVGFAVLAMEIAVLAVFVVSAVVVLARDGAHRDWVSPLTAVGGFSLTAVISAVSVAVLSYLGFDAVASFVEEAVGASAAVAKAVLWCLALAGLLFVAQTYLIALLEPMTPQQLRAAPGAQGSAFYDTVETSVGHWLHLLVASSKAVGAAFAALAGQAAAGRLLFAMGREGRLPRALGQVEHHAGRGGLGGEPGRRARPAHLGGERRRAHRLRAAARLGDRLVHRPAALARPAAARRPPGARDRGDRGGGGRGVGHRAGGGRGLAGGGAPGPRRPGCRRAALASYAWPTAALPKRRSRSARSPR